MGTTMITILETLGNTVALREAGFTKAQANLLIEAAHTTAAETIATRPGLERLGTRLELGLDTMDSRFEMVDERIDATNSRFETLDLRLDTVSHRLRALGRQLEASSRNGDSEQSADQLGPLDSRLETICSRLNRIESLLDGRFDAIEDRIEGRLNALTSGTDVGSETDERRSESTNQPHRGG